MSVEIVDRASADTDYTIAYIDGRPAAVVEEDNGGYYAVLSDGEYVHNRYDQRNWWVDDGEWHNGHAQPALVDVMEGYTLRNVSDGDQEVYDGDLDDL